MKMKKNEKNIKVVGVGCYEHDREGGFECLLAERVP